MDDIIERSFTLVVGEKPTLAFRARSYKEALELAREPWLRSDLMELTSYSASLWDGQEKLTVRQAAADEAHALSDALKIAEPGGDLLLAYLVELDSAGT